MVLEFERSNQDLNEALPILDKKYEDAGGDPKLAYQNLTPTELEFIVSEVQKICNDFRYYLENYHFIKSKREGLKLLCPLWDSQQMFLEVALADLADRGMVRMVVLKARQLGITSIGVAFIFWRTITRMLTHCLSMSDEEERVSVNFEMARTAWENLPWWFRPEKRYDIRNQLLGFDRAKVEDRVKNPGLKSQIYFECANQPSGAAYSKSLFGVHLAEVSRYRNSNAITEGVFGSLVTGAGTIGIMESTAHGRHDTWHRICEASQAGKLPWRFLFIEWFREPGYQVAVPANFDLTSEERAIQKKVKEECQFEMTPEQFEWRRGKISEFEFTDGTPEKFQQEFPIDPEEAFLSTGSCAFSKKRLQEQRTYFSRSPKWVGSISLDAKDDKTPHLSKVEDGQLEIWDFPRPGCTYYISADPSMGIESGDPACAQVLLIPEDIKQPIKQVARWHGWIGPSQFARIICALGYLYNTAEICPECNQITIVASDMVKVLMYPKWYRWIREDKAKSAISHWIGWQTTFRNKNELIARFRQALNEWTIVLRSKNDIEEALDFVETEPGSQIYGARFGAHDDGIMSLMIGYYCATQMRPRLDTNYPEQKPPEGTDYQNTDFSPVFDKDAPPDDDGITSFDML